MGAVYRAQHALLRRPTAIKILPPERAGQMDLARFEREVQMTSLLTSPHTVSIYDYGRTPDGLFYYAMEYLDGIDLNELVRRYGPMHPGRVIRVLREVCESLAEAHREGLIHRDVKPANILVSESGGKPDFVKVVDFGLVKSLAGDGGGVTSENIVLGTPYYMAPENLRSPDRIDERSDVYALGATAYFLLTGKPVFDGSSTDVFEQLLRDEPVRPSESGSAGKCRLPSNPSSSPRSRRVPPPGPGAWKLSAPPWPPVMTCRSGATPKLRRGGENTLHARVSRARAPRPASRLSSSGGRRGAPAWDVTLPSPGSNSAELLVIQDFRSAACPPSRSLPSLGSRAPLLFDALLVLYAARGSRPPKADLRP